VKFSPDGLYLLSGNFVGIASLWDVATGAEVQRFVYPSTVQIYGVDFSPDGKSILIGGFDFASPVSSPVVEVWDIQTGKESPLWLSLPTAPVQRAAFSPDGQTILTAHSMRLQTNQRYWMQTGQYPEL
jgi:WD40 repeat protein